MGEVCKMVNLEPYVLRFWEKEFNVIKPHRRDKLSNRRYTLHDIEIIEKIKCLLYEQRYTIEGAKKQLKLLKQEDSKEKVIREIKRRVKKLGKIIREMSILIVLVIQTS